MNTVSCWLYIIATPERALRLNKMLDALKPPAKIDPVFGPEPPLCPTAAMFGPDVSAKLYADPAIRPALDAWDTGEVTPDDIRHWCIYIQKNMYKGPKYHPWGKFDKSPNPTASQR